MIITSADNATYKQYLKLSESKYRKKNRSFLIEGEHLVQEAIKHKRLKTLILKESETSNIDFDSKVILSDKLFNQLSSTVSNCTVMGECVIVDESNIVGNRVLVCERIQDPGNMGTLIRSACAFGFDQIICTEDCVDIYNEKVIRSTQGALFQIPIQISNIETSILALKDKGFKVYGTGFKNSIALAQVNPTFPSALILGNEGQGLSDIAIYLSDEIISIEMHDFDSLNVAVAGAILMYAFRKS